MFASSRPGGALLGTLMGGIDPSQVRLQVLSGGAAPGQVLLKLHDPLYIAALAMVARQAEYPQAWLVSYVKGTQ